MTVLLMENGKNKINESLQLKSGDLRREKAVLMADIQDGGPSFLSWGGPAIKSKGLRTSFPYNQRGFKKFFVGGGGGDALLSSATCQYDGVNWIVQK